MDHNTYDEDMLMSLADSMAASAASFSSHSYDNFIQARDQFKAALHSLFNIEQI